MGLISWGLGRRTGGGFTSISHVRIHASNSDTKVLILSGRGLLRKKDDTSQITCRAMMTFVSRKGGRPDV